MYMGYMQREFEPPAGRARRHPQLPEAGVQPRAAQHGVVAEAAILCVCAAGAGSRLCRLHQVSVIEHVLTSFLHL